MILAPSFGWGSADTTPGEGRWGGSTVAAVSTGESGTPVGTVRDSGGGWAASIVPAPNSVDPWTGVGQTRAGTPFLPSPRHRIALLVALPGADPDGRGARRQRWTGGPAVGEGGDSNERNT